jgi:glycopeptide antibiotics resistance protein
MIRKAVTRTETVTVGIITAAIVTLVLFGGLWPSHIDAGAPHQLITATLTWAHDNSLIPANLTYSTIEFAANIAFFIPVGGLAAHLGRRLPTWINQPVATLIGLTISTSIELAQHFLPDRTSDIRDIASNTAGAFLGALIITTREALSKEDR